MDTIEHGPATAGSHSEDFKNDLRQQVDALIDDLALDEETVQRLDPAVTARAMIAAVPTVHPFDEAAGPFYNTAGLTTWLGISRQAIAKRVRSGRLIAADLEAGGGRVYPAWQFTSSGRIPEALTAVWKLLRSSADPWTAILWLRSSNPALDGSSAAQWIADGRDPAPVETAARSDAARWAA